MVTRSMFRLMLLALVASIPFVGTALSAHSRYHDAGAVFALTNATAGNAVVAYRRAADGSLRPAGSYETGGTGTGASLSSQGAVVVSDDRRLLFAVNAGSNSISLFRVRDRGLQLVDVVASGGTMPTSIAVRGSLVYVLNAGVPNNVTGFRLTHHDRLVRIPWSTRPLSAASTSPAQVGFSADGDSLIVTERATNVIDTFVIDRHGRLDGPFVNVSAGPTPFGFAVGARNTLFVSEAGAGGGASTYRVRDERLVPVTAMIVTGQRAACWAVITPDGRFGYVTNAGTGNISAVEIARDGSAVLLDADGVTAETGGNPTDMALSQDGRYLYARVAALNQIAVFRITRHGALTALPALAGTPDGLAGLAGF